MEYINQVIPYVLYRGSRSPGDTRIHVIKSCGHWPNLSWTAWTFNIMLKYMIYWVDGYYDAISQFQPRGAVNWRKSRKYANFFCCAVFCCNYHVRSLMSRVIDIPSILQGCFYGPTRIVFCQYRKIILGNIDAFTLPNRNRTQQNAKLGHNVGVVTPLITVKKESYLQVLNKGDATHLCKVGNKQVFNRKSIQYLSSWLIWTTGFISVG